MYFALKHLHMLCAVISIIGFIVRGALRIQGSTLLQRKWLRITPHIVDTLLLLSAIGFDHQYSAISIHQRVVDGKIAGAIRLYRARRSRNADR